MRKKLNQREDKKGITYKCNRCSYVIYKQPNELPPTFCPNCAINHLKGGIVRVMQPLDYKK